MNHSWLEVEMDESITLIRKKLEELNAMDVEDFDEDAMCEMHRAYKILHRVIDLKMKIK